MHTKTIKIDYGTYKKQLQLLQHLSIQEVVKNGNTAIFEIRLIKQHSITEEPEEVWSKDNANSRWVHLIDRFILCDQQQQRD